MNTVKPWEEMNSIYIFALKSIIKFAKSQFIRPSPDPIISSLSIYHCVRQIILFQRKNKIEIKSEYN